MSDAAVVLVTGASGHLGGAIARHCAMSGMSVAVHYRSGEASAHALVDELRSVGADAAAFPADLAGEDSQADTESLVASVMDRFGRLDGLVANSAQQQIGEMSELSDSHWNAMFDANLMAIVRLVRAATPVLAPGASIVTISSVEAAMAFPRHAHYAASKAAVESLTRSLALELGPHGIRVNAVAPGLIDRDGLVDAWPEGYRWWTSTAPTGRPVTAQEVAAVVAFLLQDQATGVSGAVIPVDGGWSASARAPF